MSRRMIDQKTIIKSQIVDDKWRVDLNEIVEKYGWQDIVGGMYLKSVTIQFYAKQAMEDDDMQISSDTGNKGAIVTNTAITISKDIDDGWVYIRGLLVDDLYSMNFMTIIYIEPGDYENGIILQNPYEFDVYVIKV